MPEVAGVRPYSNPQGSRPSLWTTLFSKSAKLQVQWLSQDDQGIMAGVRMKFQVRKWLPCPMGEMLFQLCNCWSLLKHLTLLTRDQRLREREEGFLQPPGREAIMLGFSQGSLEEAAPSVWLLHLRQSWVSLERPKAVLRMNCPWGEDSLGWPWDGCKGGGALGAAANSGSCPVAFPGTLSPGASCWSLLDISTAAQ